MATNAQITANQINAQSSSGPKTPEGKAAASRNATTHGLHSANPVLPQESQAAFDDLHARYRKELQPAGLHEDFLVRQVAEARWRLERLQKIEAELMDQLASGQARENPHAAIAASMLEKDGAESLLRLHRMASSVERAYHRNYNALARGRRERQLEQDQQLDQAMRDFIFAPMPGRSRASGENRQNEPNPPAKAPLAVHPIRPSHVRNEANRDSLALRL